MQEPQEQPKTTSSKPGKRGDKYSRVKALPKTTGLLSSPGLGNPNIISHDVTNKALGEGERIKPEYDGRAHRE